MPLAKLVYRFQFPDGRTESLQVRPAVPAERTADLPAWTALGFHQCANCPRIEFLKPMAHYHLPFSTQEETTYRVVSTYLLSQYFLRQQGKAADAGLGGLKANYRELQQVNAKMAARLGAVKVEGGDSSVNALVLLDVFAQSLPDSIDQALEELQPAFQKLLPASPPSRPRPSRSGPSA